ncbi:transporter substrate-binding domain-containing protein [Paraburkholderia phenoliruptrix]|uniref:Transporter substrate-binding domain-containing protein n=1 Tax=Paraburkholderia phenoliruptrix TaxID=252970 RepID=A0ABV3WHJ2_9BURK|nr:transporter substrate-binding domain-containing protein [Paraburkholderia phenoliruptrix]MDR6392520.1 polar amino acid transport system substrate-binding protein [Paraburkholderia phenoliruptrix]
MQAGKISAGMLVVGAVLQFMSPAFADQLADIRSRGEVTCGVYSNVEPFSYPNAQTRQLEGMDVDLCNAVAKQLGVKAKLEPLAVEARIPQLKLGRVDLVVANLAYTKTRATQIAFSDSYYSTKEVLVVKKADAGKKLTDFAGQKISAADGSTSAQSIPLSIKDGQAVTFHDTSSAFLALEQDKVKGFVTNQMTARKIAKQVEGTDGAVAIAAEPMLIEPIAVGLRQNEPAMLAAVNKALASMEQSGEMSAIFDKWLGPKTPYGLTRTDKVTPINQLKFTPVS